MELNVLEKIERDLIEKYSEKGDIILMGDFNDKDKCLFSVEKKTCLI
jgi:endonuclease/exonuclease/phosphatase family metal-dependent hydrolase